MITYAGIDLLLEDPDGLVQAWLDQFLSLDDLRIVSDWTTARLNRDGGLPLPNYSKPLKPQLNTWYRPTGASRWSFGLFLATTEIKDQILSAIGSLAQQSSEVSKGATLRIGYEVPGVAGFDETAYLLPPWPISAEIDDPLAVWILPLVDVRYFWQFAVGPIPVPNEIPVGDLRYLTTVWPTFLALFEGSLNIANFQIEPNSLIADGSVYGRADPVSFISGNAAVMLDAAAHSVGMRLVSDPTAGTEAFRIVTWTGSRIILAENLARQNAGALQSGTFTNAQLNKWMITPTAVVVIFREVSNGIILDTEYSVTTNLTDIETGTDSNSSYLKVIRTTALADFTGLDPDTDPPSNVTECGLLAKQIATDFYSSLYWIQDSVYIGTQEWHPSGFDDYIEHTVAKRMEDGRYTTHTRVHTMPFNFGVDRMLHAFADAHEFVPDQVMGFLTGDLSAFGTATLAVYVGDPLTDSLRTLTVTEQYGATASSGDPIRAFRIGSFWIADTGGTGGTTTPNLVGTAQAFKSAADGSGSFTTAVGTKTATITRGLVYDGEDYVLVWVDDDHYEVANPELTFVGKPTTLTQFGATATVTVYAGTKGSETTTSSTVDGFIRDGLVYDDTVYQFHWIGDGWDCIDPTTEFVGKTDAAIDKGASGTISIYSGTVGSESDTTTNVTGVYNRFADAASDKWVLVTYRKKSKGWELNPAEC